MSNRKIGKKVRQRVQLRKNCRTVWPCPPTTNNFGTPPNRRQSRGFLAKFKNRGMVKKVSSFERGAT